MPIHVTTSTTQSLSNKTFVDRLSTTGIVYADSGNSSQWSSTYSSVYATSATWDSAYTSLNTNSAKYDSVYTNVGNNSAWWDSTYNTVYTNSGSWEYQGADIRALTANWQNTYTTVSAYSASWGAGGGTDSQTLSFDESNAQLSISNGNFVSLSALSSSGGGGGGGITVETDPIFTTWAQANSGKYESTYTTVSAITGNLILGQLGISIDGAGSVISTGIKQYLRVPYNCTITSYELVVSPFVPGFITINVLKSTWEDYPPVNSITGYGTPVINTIIDNGIKIRGTNLAGFNWTTALTTGEYLGFNVTSVSAITAATLTLITLR
jgi:hypothetical protein